MTAGSPFEVRFHGVRGSLPASGPQVARYGGNTICIEMRCAGSILMFDAGTGMYPAGKLLKAETVEQVDLFFTHCHYDHIMGFPFFAPFFESGARAVIWSGHLAGKMTTREMIDGLMAPPYFPAKMDVCRAQLVCRDFAVPEVLEPQPGIAIRTATLNHPGGAVGYRVTAAGHSVALVTDTEHEPGVLDPAVLDLVAGADLMIYDAAFEDAEMARFRGWGHSSWQQALRLAKAAGVAQVALIHHPPFRTDDELDRIGREAAAGFPGAFVARDGQVVTL